MGGQGGQGLGWGINDLGKGRWQSGMLRVIGDSGREKPLGRADRRFGEGFLGAQGVGEGVLRVVGESGGTGICGGDQRLGEGVLGVRDSGRGCYGRSGFEE